MFTANLIIKLSIMLKNILKVNGAQQLSKTEQGTINGGGPLSVTCDGYFTCLSDCINGTCSGAPHPSLPGVTCFACVPDGGGEK